MSDIDKWLSLSFSDAVMKICKHAVIILMDEILYFVYTRNCKQETTYYIQETKTIHSY